MPENSEPRDAANVEQLTREYINALRVLVPNANAQEYVRLARDGSERGALVLVGGLLEAASTHAPIPQEKQDARAAIRRIEQLEPGTRAAVEDAAAEYFQRSTQP